MPITGYSNTISVTTALDADALAYINALSADGYPLEAPEQTYINTLVTDFKSAGIWSKMKAIYPYCTSQRNLIGYSEDFGNVYWVKDKNGTGTTPIVTTNSIVAPDGTTTASRIQFDRGAGTSSSDFSLIYNQGVITLSSAGVYSFYAKSQTGSNQTLLVYWGGGQGTTFTLTPTWQRFEINNLSAKSDGIVFGTRAGSGAYYNGGQQVLDIAIWHPQLEIGSTATTYQPVATTASTIFASQFKYNLKDPRNLDAAFRQVFNGGWTYSKQGATPNGTNGYADTKLNPSNGTNPYIALSVYATNLVGANKPFMSSQDNVKGTEFNFFYNSTNSFYAAYSYPLRAIGNTNDTLGGFYLGSRISDTNVFFKQNTTNFTPTTTSLSWSATNLPNSNFAIAGQNINGTINQYSQFKASFASIGDGLTDSEASAMYTSVQNYNTSMQRQV